MPSLPIPGFAVSPLPSFSSFSTATTWRSTRACQPRRPARSPCSRTARMDAAPPSSPSTPPDDAAESASQWPPPGMTADWAEAVDRLAASNAGTSRAAADEALVVADGDEMAALRMLTEGSASGIRRQREQAVERARAGGDAKRVSAIKEAQMRRTATGSAKDFFKGFVEVEGQYVDAGYVDEGADTMGKIAAKFKEWFGKK